MSPAASGPTFLTGLMAGGLKPLELLFDVLVSPAAEAIVVVDDRRNCRAASFGAAKLFQRSRHCIVGRTLDDFAAPSVQPGIARIWDLPQKKGASEGTFNLADLDGTPRVRAFKARPNVLPARHAITFTALSSNQDPSRIPSTPGDYAYFVLDTEGRIVAWYDGAARIYGYTAPETVGRNVAFLYPNEQGIDSKAMAELNRPADAAGHFASEGWQAKKDGTRFWANTVTLGLRDEAGHLLGFARVVRDFTASQEGDLKLRPRPGRMHPIAAESRAPGVVFGEFDRITKVNDVFLEISGYRREELQHLPWSAFTPSNYAALDEAAHEEGLLYGACAPFEKELVRKDGAHIAVRLSTTVLELCPFRWVTSVQNLGEPVHQPAHQLEESGAGQDVKGMVGASDALRRVERLIEVVAPTDASVLIVGETGTGKELVARAIHRLSPRSHLPFVTLNCAAIPTGLLESELFGYEKGAFTGALSQKPGRFELAHRGTLFLDEVGDIPLELQPKLLRALQEKSFERLGGTKTIPIDVRVVAATNRDLNQMMADQLFRSDLYYRLKVFPIPTPPLRERPEDIPVLVRHFVRVYGGKMGRKIETIPLETLRVLAGWRWPGNVRELENFIERAVILSNGSILNAPLADLEEAPLKAAGSDLLEQVERDHILRVLRESDGVVTVAATRMGLHRTTLNATMRRLGISPKGV